MLYQDNHYDHGNGILSIRQPPVSQATREKAMKNRAGRGRSEGDNDKAPSTSRFHFSKGNYGNIVLVWHGVLIQEAKANLLSIRDCHGLPWGFPGQPAPVPAETHAHSHGCGFS